MNLGTQMLQSVLHGCLVLVYGDVQIITRLNIISSFQQNWQPANENMPVRVFDVFTHELDELNEHLVTEFIFAMMQISTNRVSE